MASLEALGEEIRACPKCDLCQTRTHAVPGEGPNDSRILLIGEGPGYYEDKSGRPFVGAAGKFLEELLELAGLRREDVFITNIVKCRPPNNRDPLPAEVVACKPWLDQQIELLNPNVVVTLGRHSMSRYFPGESISRIHGQARRTGNRTVVPMLHPAAALHQQRYRSLIEEDFRNLPGLMRTAVREDETQVAKPASTSDDSEQMRLF